VILKNTKGSCNETEDVREDVEDDYGKENTPRMETWECEESISPPIFTPNFRDVPITPSNYGERGSK
jgi:hypothetical protein